MTHRLTAPVWVVAMAAPNASRRCPPPPHPHPPSPKCRGPQVATPSSCSDVRCGRSNRCSIPRVVMLRGLEAEPNACLQECDIESVQTSAARRDTPYTLQKITDARAHKKQMHQCSSARMHRCHRCDLTRFPADAIQASTRKCRSEKG